MGPARDELIGEGVGILLEDGAGGGEGVEERGEGGIEAGEQGREAVGEEVMVEGGEGWVGH